MFLSCGRTLLISNLICFNVCSPCVLLFGKTRIIQFEHNAVTNSQYGRQGTIELNSVTAEIHEDVLGESIYEALSLTGINVVPEDLQACHRMKRLDRVSKI